MPLTEKFLRTNLEQMAVLSEEMGEIRKPRKEIFLSIVIPAFNEINRFPNTVLATLRWCRSNISTYEILIADDGSSDGTLEAAKIFSEYFSTVRTVACPHMGKGATVRAGMLNADGDHVLFMDADGATHLDEIQKLLKKMEEGYKIAIGSRVVRHPGETVVQAHLHRKIVGRVFAKLVNASSVDGITDTQCGFKMFKKEVVRPLFGSQKLSGFAFDVEILYLAKKLSVPIVEVPVNWTDQAGSKVRVSTDSFRMLKDVMRIRFLHKL